MTKGFTKQQLKFRQAVQAIQVSGLYQNPIEICLLEVIRMFASLFVQGKLSAKDLPGVELPAEGLWDFGPVNYDAGPLPITLDLTADGIITSVELFEGMLTCYFNPATMMHKGLSMASVMADVAEISEP